MEGALVAIAEGSLERLEDHLWQQQILCARLQQAVLAFCATGLEAPAVTDLKQAFEGLVSVARVYQDTLFESRSSLDILYRLCLAHQPANRTHGTQSGEGPYPCSA